jgi:hypothetical protein
MSFDAFRPGDGVTRRNLRLTPNCDAIAEPIQDG